MEPTILEARQILEEASTGVEKLYALVSRCLSSEARTQALAVSYLQQISQKDQELAEKEAEIKRLKVVVSQLEQTDQYSRETAQRLYRENSDCHYFLFLRKGPDAGKTLLERLRIILGAEDEN